MYEKFIRNHIHLLNPSLTKQFLQKNHILVTNKEAEIITRLAKENWEKLYHKDYLDTFRLLKEKVGEQTYNQVFSLYLNAIKTYL